MIGSGLSKPARGQIQFHARLTYHSSRSPFKTPQNITCINPLSLSHLPDGGKVVRLSLFLPSFYLVSQFKRKTLKVADLKEICTRANVPTTTRLTKADLITKILASQPAIDAYNAKYQQNGNAAPSSNPAPPSTHDDIVSRNASL
jgi:hypothetical protein